MAELSHAYIALPGGIGTLEETFEAWTWLQLEIQRKPIGLLNVAGYYDSLEKFLDEVAAQGFLAPVTRAQLHSEASPVALVDTLLPLMRKEHADHVADRT
jgi:uncharacterized protein (TIGR00730 family)